MTLWTEPPRIRQQRTLEEFPSPGLDALGAAATQALYDSPSWQIKRRLEDSRAQDPYIWEYDDYGARIIGDKPMVDKATAIAKAKEQGVELKIPDAGVTEDFLALQIKRKKEYQQREDIRARSPKGLLFGTAEFTTGLAASMLDPLNIAASFIPVGRLVAPAMAMRAETAATLGQRTLARAGIGAIEGTVGQALVEPLTAFSYSQEQLDYTLVDSLQNIAFGAIIGSAAHTGFGLVRDKLGPKPQTQFQQFMDNLDPTVKINALKAEVANLVEGRNGDISPIVKSFTEKPAPVTETVYHRTTRAFEGDFQNGENKLEVSFAGSRGFYFSKDLYDPTARVFGNHVIAAKVDVQRPAPVQQLAFGSHTSPRVVVSVDSKWLAENPEAPIHGGLVVANSVADVVAGRSAERPDTFLQYQAQISQAAKNGTLFRLINPERLHDADVSLLEAKGYDGINYDRPENAKNSMPSQVVALRPEQIKRISHGTPDEVAAAVKDLARKADLYAASRVEPETAAQTTFTTAKGSSYVVNEDGTTTRNKAFRAEDGPAEQGLMPKSQTTFYVDDAGLNALGEFQALGTGKKRLVQLPDGRYGMQYEEGPSAGKIEDRTVSNVSSTPQIGMYPVELWEDGSVVHFGNKITALNKVQTAAQTVEPKQTAVDMDSVARAAEQRYAPENNKYADVQALKELDAMPVKDDAVLLKEQADDMMAEAKMHAEQLGLDLPELKQLADIDAKATQYAKAVKAAAVCGIRG